MKIKRVIAVLPIVFLVFLIPVAYSYGSNPVRITVTLHIPVIQRLTISSNYPSIITVKNEGKDIARSSIDLEEDIDLGQDDEEIKLPKAIDLDVLSNVDWKLLVSAENLVLSHTGQAGPPVLDLMVRAANLPPGVTGGSSYVTVPFNVPAPFVEGTAFSIVPAHKSFSVDYLLKLRQKDNVTVQGIKVDLVYTLMRL